MPDHILLVEDEYALRMTLGDRLGKAGYLADCAADSWAWSRAAKPRNTPT